MTIAKVIIKNKDELPTCWWPKVRWLSRTKEFEFTPGINIICGPNGSGKSTLLMLIAQTFHCYQGGVPKVTRQSVDDLTHAFEDMGYNGYDINHGGYDVNHDGGYVFYINPDKTVGTCSIGFDDDFFAEGLNNLFTASVQSQGENTIFKTVGIIKQMGGHKNTDLERFKKGVNSLWKEMAETATRIIGEPKPDFKKRKTLLIDEPERSLDFQNEIQFWRGMEKMAKDVQVIIATHSPFALYLDGNYIETKKGYVKDCKKLISEHCR